MNFVSALYVTLMLSLISFSANSAEILQILHTNDVHSYFEHTHHDPTRGGYGRIKTMIDQLKQEAADKGIKTLVMDGGDFTEGSLFYMADEGVRSFEMYDLMGYDVAVMGNHDYLMGTDKFDDALSRSNPKVRFLAANVKVEDRFKYLKSKVEGSVIFDYNGYKLAVMGLTTNEAIYRWRLYDGNIFEPVKYAMLEEKRLKLLKGVDGIIALTHIGVKRDQKLVDKTRYVDLVVGGHSHTELHKPEWAINNNKHLIPIVQTGEHGRYIGRLMVKLEKGKGVQLVSSELVPVVDVEKDPVIEDQIARANDDLNTLYGNAWLNYVVGNSLLSPKSEMAQTQWVLFVTDAMRESARTDIAIHTASMTGPDYPITGPVSRRDLLEAHPRFFDFNDYRGWYVYRAKVHGFLIKQVFKTVMKYNLGLTFSGVTFRVERDITGGIDLKDIRIGGKKIKPLQVYSLAMPEGVARGGAHVTSLARWVFKAMHRTPYTVINTLENHFRKVGTITENYSQLTQEMNPDHKYIGAPIPHRMTLDPNTLETKFY